MIPEKIFLIPSNPGNKEFLPDSDKIGGTVTIGVTVILQGSSSRRDNENFLDLVNLIVAGLQRKISAVFIL
ncbi:unnamed protein product, partial [Brenthis ino]